MTYQSNPYLKEACESEIYSLIYAPHSWLWGVGDADFKIVQRYHPVGSYDSARWVEGIYPMLVTQYALKIVQNHLDYLLFIDPQFPGLSPAFVASLRQFPLYEVPKKITVEIPAQTTCLVTYLRSQGHVNYRNADHLTIYVVEKTNFSTAKETVEIELTGCVINSVEIRGGTLVSGASPNLLLSDLSSVVSSFCSLMKTYLKYARTYINIHYQIIQLVSEAVVTGGGNLNPGKWHYETITWGGLWEKTVVVYDELPSGSGSYFMAVWRVTQWWAVNSSVAWVDYPLENNPICIIYASNDHWNQKFPIKADVGNLAESSTFIYKIGQTSSQMFSDITTNSSDILRVRDAQTYVGYFIEKLPTQVFTLNGKARVYPTYPLKYWKEGDSTHLESGYYHVFSKPVAFSFDENAELAVSFNETNHLIHDDGSEMNYISFGAYPIFPINPHETLYFKNNSFTRALPMANTVEILEIHAALNAGQYGKNPVSPKEPRRWNLGAMIHAIAVSQGLNFDANGKIMAPDKSVEYDDGDKVYNRYGVNQAGIAWNDKDAKGKSYGESVPFIGYLYDVLTPKVKANEFTGELSDTDTGGMVGCPNLPALMEAFSRDIMKALGGDETVVVVPSADGLGYGVYEGLASMSSESLYMQSYASAVDMKTFINSQKTVGMLQEVLRGQGLQIEPKEFFMTVNNVPVKGVYPGLAGTSPSQTDIQLLVLAQLAHLLPLVMNGPMLPRQDNQTKPSGEP